MIQLIRAAMTGADAAAQRNYLLGACIRAVVADLRVEPSVDGVNERSRMGDVCDRAAVRDLGVSDVQLTRL